LLAPLLLHICFYPNTKNIALESIKESYKKGELNNTEYINKKREVTFFGYTNQRKFWYAIGKPIAMLYFSILLMYSSFYINEKALVSIFKKISILVVSISFYFIIWAFWYRADFPKTLYFILIGVVSVLSTIFSFKFIESENAILEKIKILTKHIVILGKKHVPLENRVEYVEDYMKTFDKITDN